MKLILLTLAAVAVLLPRCSSAPSDLAGGSGAGNPGAVMLSIQVDTTAGLGKRNALARVGIKDDDSLDFEVTGALVVVQRIQFILDQSQSCEEIGRLVKPPLVYDSSSISLDSTVVFNVLTGETEPVLNALSLPAARYTGIKLTIAAESADSNTIALSGSFAYDSALHGFTFRFSQRSLIFYHHANDTFAVAPDDTTRLLLALDARQWLDGCRIKYCLNNGGISLDTGGDLVIFDSTGSAECGNLGSKIASNIVSSGMLRAQK